METIIGLSLLLSTVTCVAALTWVVVRIALFLWTCGDEAKHEPLSEDQMETIKRLKERGRTDK